MGKMIKKLHLNYKYRLLVILMNMKFMQITN